MRPRLNPRQVAFLRVLARKGGLGAYEVELAVDEAAALGLKDSDGTKRWSVERT